MPYTTTVTLLDSEGGAQDLDITATLWMLWTTHGAGSGAGNQKSDEGSFMGMLKKDLTQPLTITFPGNADFSYASRSVGLSIQDTPRTSIGEGWLFRSGSFPTVLPSDAIEIITGNTTIVPADLPGLLPAVPFTADAGTTTVITSLTATLATGGIDFVATGTTRATGVIIGLTYSGRLILFPSSDITAAETEAIGVSVANPSIVFAPGPSVLSAIEAALLNALEVVVLREFGPKIKDTLQSRLNAAIAAGVARAIPGGTLPAGVILSIRSINASTSRVLVRGALGAFGGVVSKLPPINIVPRCFIATAVHGIDSPQVQLLRAFRDLSLRQYATGRLFIRIYEYVSPNIAKAISKRPVLKSIVRRAIVDPAVFFVRRISGEK